MELLSLRAAARHLGLPEPKLYHMDDELRPEIRIRGTKMKTRLYRMDVLDAWVASGRPATSSAYAAPGEARTCRCGCGQPNLVPRKHYVDGHRPVHVRERKVVPLLRVCACGCGEALPPNSSPTRKYASKTCKDKVKQDKRITRDRAAGRRPQSLVKAEHEASRAFKEELEERLATIGILKTEKRRSLRYWLNHAWKRVTGWCQFVLCPVPIPALPDPAGIADDVWLIYALVDPRDITRRYVGYSTIGLERPKQHRSPNKYTESYHSAHWVKQLQSLGTTYGIVILEVCKRGDLVALFTAEVKWIAYGRAVGWPLTNMTDGGGGNKGWAEHITSEQRERRRQNSKKLWQDPEYRARCTPTPASKARLSELGKERWEQATAEQRKQRGTHMKAANAARTPEGRRRDKPLTRALISVRRQANVDGCTREESDARVEAFKREFELTKPVE